MENDNNNGEPVSTDDVKVEMPEDLKVYIKEHCVPEGKDFRTRLYRTFKDPKTGRWKKEFLEERINGFYEHEYGPAYIQEHYGGGTYVPLSVWKAGKGEKGLENETLSIAGPPKIPLPHSGGAPTGGTSASPGAPAAFDIKSILEYVPVITAAIEAFRSLTPKMDINPLLRLQESQLALIEKTGQEATKIKRDAYRSEVTKLEELIQKAREMQLEVAGEGEEGEETDESTIWPEWITPWIPKLEKWGEKLLGTGPLATGARKLIVKNKTFKECWSDPKKKKEAIKAMKHHLGDVMTDDLEQMFTEQMEGEKQTS